MNSETKIRSDMKAHRMFNFYELLIRRILGNRFLKGESKRARHGTEETESEKQCKNTLLFVHAVALR